jgi:hypothetical protein
MGEPEYERIENAIPKFRKAHTGHSRIKQNKSWAAGRTNRNGKGRFLVPMASLESLIDITVGPRI